MVGPRTPFRHAGQRSGRPTSNLPPRFHRLPVLPILPLSSTVFGCLPPSSTIFQFFQFFQFFRFFHHLPILRPSSSSSDSSGSSDSSQCAASTSASCFRPPCARSRLRSRKTPPLFPAQRR